MSNPKRETLEQAGLFYLMTKSDGTIVLYDMANHVIEYWVVNNGHASYGLWFGLDVLEFCGSRKLNPNESFEEWKQNNARAA